MTNNNDILNLLGVADEPVTPAEPSKTKKVAKQEAKKKPAKKPATRTSKVDATAYAQDFTLSVKRETRSRRVQLLMTPTLYDVVKEEADKNGTNVNELINAILEGVLTK